MSYILEALKQAEEERGSDRLSKVLTAQPVDELQQNAVDWKKWLTIAIFVNAVVLFVWIAWKFFAVSTDPEVSSKSVQSELGTVVSATPTAEALTEPLSSTSETKTVSKPAEPLATVDTVSTAERAETRSSVNAAITPKETVPAITKPVQTPPVSPVEKAEPEVAAIVEKKIIPSEVATAKAQEPKSLPVDQIQALPPETKSTMPVLDTPQIKAEISAPKVEPLPATPREQLAMETTQEVEQPKPEMIEPEVAEPQFVEPIAAVQRPPVPEFAELPYSLQQKIPEIRISVHIFNSEPQQRKVRINGQIFREGDEVARDLWVEEITPRGVIFDYDQTVFRLNLH